MKMHWTGLSSLWVFALLSAFSCQSLTASDLEHLISLSAAFETARATGDFEAAKRMTLPDAQWIQEPSTDASLIVPEMEAFSLRLSEGKSKPEVTFVAERSVLLHGDSAVVTELVRVTADVPQPPVRRSVFWVRDAASWKIAHIHSSPHLRWESDIAAFETADQQSPPTPGGVVFIGSSSVRRWDSLANDFPGVQVLNRGFGGSQMIDSVLAAKRIVTSYAPVAVIVYAGDNDIGKGKHAERVLEDFQNFVSSIHDELPQSQVAFIAIKPSLKRWSMWPEIQRANQLIQNFAAGHPNVAYLDVATPMLDETGMPRQELFVSDGLHLSVQGYAVWTEVIRPWVNRVAAINPKPTE